MLGHLPNWPGVGVSHLPTRSGEGISSGSSNPTTLPHLPGPSLVDRQIPVKTLPCLLLRTWLLINSSTWSYLTVNWDGKGLLVTDKTSRNSFPVMFSSLGFMYVILRCIVSVKVTQLNSTIKFNADMLQAN